jgi:hypothetical protein
MDSSAFGAIIFGAVVLHHFLGSKVGQEFTSWFYQGFKKIGKNGVKVKAKTSVLALAEEGLAGLKHLASVINSMGKTIELIAQKLEVKVETPKPEAEEEEEEEAPAPLLAGLCQSRKADGVTQCGFKLPKGKEQPWLCGLHMPRKEEETAAE